MECGEAMFLQDLVGFLKLRKWKWTNTYDFKAVKSRRMGKLRIN
jgi:hypothetical protein